jgi:predicted lipid-binding transport protein (Tim44 family)
VQYFDIILFAIIAGVLVVRLYRILGVKSKIIIEKKEKVTQKVVNIKQEIKKPFESTDVENGTGLEYLIKIYPQFNKKEFISGAEKAFKMILSAKSKANKKFLISYLEDDVYRIFEKSILEREEKGQTVEKTNIEIKDKNIQEIKILDNIVFIRVEFDYLEGLLIRNSNGSILSDNVNSPKEINITWTFSRPLDSDSPIWKLFGTNQIN